MALLYFLGFHLFPENTDGPLELMCSGTNGPWTFCPDLLKDCTFLKEKSVTFGEVFQSLFPDPFVSFCLNALSAFINENFLQVSKLCASLTSSSNSQSNLLLHIVTPRGDSKMDIWTMAARLRESLQLDHFLIAAINSLSAWHFNATFSAG